MSSEPDSQRSQFLVLRDRAYAFLVDHQPVTQEALLAHIYGGQPPKALHARLAAPLLDDPRLVRLADETWSVVGRPADAEDVRTLALTTLALAATGPSPTRGRLVRIAAEYIQSGVTVERFTATINPGGRVPGYVAERLGLAPAALEDLPPFSSIVDDLLQFLGERPVVAQDARLSWAFVEAEVRRLGRVVVEPVLVDANQIATRLLALPGKPTLSLVAGQLGIGIVRIGRPEEEARVLGQVTTRLLAAGFEQGCTTLANLVGGQTRDGQTALRRGQTAQALPDEPGVYVMRDAEQVALYVGKARRLQSRVAAYRYRPLGATRRLEGLVGVVKAVDSTVCETDLEALILEAREIRRLQPRFNTVRQLRPPRVWIRLPPVAELRAIGKRQPAQRRLEASAGPRTADGEFVGPFRNEMLAGGARRLARDVFELDGLRRTSPQAYAQRLTLAWAFLTSTQAEARITAETYAAQRSTRLLRRVVAFDLPAMLLPADPRDARYAVVRAGQGGIEGFVVDRGIFCAWSRVCADEPSELAPELLAAAEPRTGPDDVDLVLRWLGAQRLPARLVHLPDDPVAASDAIQDAALALADWLRKA